MPAIYTFSLDFVRDRDIIELLESKKNRSDFLRTILRKEELAQFYIDLFHDVHDHYRTQFFMNRGRTGLTKEDFMVRRRKINNKKPQTDTSEE